MEFSGEIPDHTKHLEGIKQVDDENGVIHHNTYMEETEFHHTGKEFGHGFMQENVVPSANQSPEKGIEGADDTTVVKPVIRIIPKADVHPDDEDPTRNQLNQGHGDRHDQDYQHFCKPSIRIQSREGNEGHAVYRTQSGAVKRIAGTGKKTGIYPAFGLPD